MKYTLNSVTVFSSKKSLLLGLVSKTLNDEVTHLISSPIFTLPSFLLRPNPQFLPSYLKCPTFGPTNTAVATFRLSVLWSKESSSSRKKQVWTLRPCYELTRVETTLTIISNPGSRGSTLGVS